MKKVKLNNYENEIENNAENFVKISKTKKEKIEKIIDKANQKISVTLRLNNQDLESIKNRAIEEGLPYQTLISSILHKYAANKLIDDKNLIKIIKLVKS